MGLGLPAKEHPGDTLVITGWRGVGKTTLCQKVVERARQAGRQVTGLLSLGRFDAGEKTGILAMDLGSGQTRRLASLIEGELEGAQLGPWTFDTKVLEWGNTCLKQSARTDLLVIDEIGPLEFEKGLGWVSSFEILRRQAYQLAIVVIRPEFLDAFLGLGFSCQTREVTIETNLDHLAACIITSANRSRVAAGA
jgi:nucleoside-triphosphatase